MGNKISQAFSKWMAILLVIFIFFSINIATVYSQSEAAEGFASMDSLGQNGTTGGKGGTVVTVTNTAEFLNYIQKPGAYVIRVDGTITLSDMVNVQSHKTIVGVGSNGIISGGGLNMTYVSNIIIRNLLFQNSLDDAINIEDESHHVWIDHCDFTNAYDGLVDIKTGADFITVSWNKFYNHTKTCLLGHDDNNRAQDTGHLRVTYHHNWFNGTAERHPRARFSALCHVYNNYYLGNNYGIASTMDAEVLVENNYFKNVSDPTWVGYGTSGPGDLVERNNIYDNCPNLPRVRGEVPEPPYAYSLDNAADVPAKLQTGAGRAGYIEKITGPQWLVYDASFLPDENDPAFSPVNVTNPPDTTSWIIPDPDISGNKLLKFIDSVTVNGKFMWGFNWNINRSQGATIAFRVKPIDPAVFQRTFEVEFRDGAISEKLFVLPDGVIELDRADTINVLPSDIAEWHTYRITYQNGVSHIYLNEDLMPFLSGTSTATNSSNDVRFGDGSDSNTYGFWLDWFIFDTTGVYSPGESNIPDSLKVDRPMPASGWVIYEANVLPNENDPAFSPVNVTNPPDTTSWIIDDPDIVGNKLLKFIDSMAVSGKFMWGINWNMEPAVGATIAFRVKPIDPEVYQRTFEVEFRDGNIRERLFVLPGGKIALDRADVDSVLPSRIDDWHTYRITYQNGISNVYLNENSTPFLTGTSTSTSSSKDIRFGDGSDDNAYGFLLDWLVFDTTGAFKPGETEIPKGLFTDKYGPDQRHIVFVSLPGKIDPATGKHADQPFIDDLIAADYYVTTFYSTTLATEPQSTIDMLDSADLVIIGRSGTSADFSGANKAAWNAVRAPMLNLQLYAARNNRMNWFNTDTAPHYNSPMVTMNAIIEAPDDSVFGGLTLIDSRLPWCIGPYDVLEIKEAGNGTLLARSYVDSTVLFVRFEPWVEFYNGSGDMPAGYRTLIGNGNDNTGIFNYYNFTEQSRQVYLAEVARMVKLGIAEQPTSVKEQEISGMPISFQLYQNFPNPFNPTTNIEFQLPESGKITITIYNALGQRVTTLVDGYLESGRHRIFFEAGDYSSGIYYYRIKSAVYTQTKKMLLVR